MHSFSNPPVNILHDHDQRVQNQNDDQRANCEEQEHADTADKMEEGLYEG